ncbi:AraC family transcriptional regulator [Marinomonas sp. C2222]|uniref:AraC family transcriptional regulator n=1 Tax=Marinomonas sargassi TaxID=2984494 RepID=A0ABT2YNL1_9GAMM|nr:AraC family transcriptional regulator [Marinomonas sargassi]MCV2401478.1 AraC family transcriptional regulator [Marinomonas sargassi]
MMSPDIENTADFLKKYRLSVSTDELKNASLSSAYSSPNMEGMMISEPLNSGMIFHMANIKATQDLSFEAEFSSNFKIALMFSGDMRFRYGTQKVFMEKMGKTARVMNFNQSEGCSMDAKKGDHRTALYLSVQPDWFEENGIESPRLNNILNNHLTAEDWELPDFLWHQAKLLFAQNDQSYVSRMAREGFALSFMSTWLGEMTQEGKGVQRSDGRRAHQFKELLNSDDVLTMSLTAISNQLGMSSATLQRYARDYLNMSLTQYLRKRRLDLAKTALHQDGVSIMEASLLAGYNHSSNFTTAFKRQFGVSPAASYSLSN